MKDIHSGYFISLYKKWKNIAYLMALMLMTIFISDCASDDAKVNQENNGLMGSGFGIQEATLMVQNLDSVHRFYSEVLGFDIRIPEEYEKGIYEGSIGNAIMFPDMSSLQFLSLEDSVMTGNDTSYIKSFLQQNEGVRTYSLSSSSTYETFDWLTSQGFKPDSVRSYRLAKESPEGWDWDDGGPQLLILGFDSLFPPAHLPEFVELADFPYERMDEWNSFYNMQRGFVRHPNGVVGISAIQIVVEDLESARKEFNKMGFPELAMDKEENTVRFGIKRNQELLIISPQSPDDLHAKFLLKRGPGVFGLRFEVEDLYATYDSLKMKLSEDAIEIDTLSGRITVFNEYAYGIQLEFEEEPESQAILANQLKLNFNSKLDSTALKYAEGMYLKYCALCHGENREGYAADFAPSLRSHSLMSTTQGSNFLRYTIQYGRAGTAMAGYYDALGGPLEYIEIELLLKWLYETSGVEEPVELSRDPVKGDVELGSQIYARKCVSCHGPNGEGVTAPALGNPMLLATATDDFLRYAIREGRDSTLMVGFKDSLSTEEIDAVTAFLRSRASGWNIPKGDSIKIPSPDEYVLNPENRSPNFDLREGLYVSAEQLNKAIQDSLRLVILDARSEVAWRQTHIPGSIPVPYYEEPEAFVEDIPKDSTMIVAYCACPHAASTRVVNTLKRYGFENTAILDEGILVWAQMGFPVQHGQ